MKVIKRISLRIIEGLIYSLTFIAHLYVMILLYIDLGQLPKRIDSIAWFVTLAIIVWMEDKIIKKERTRQTKEGLL